MYAISLLLQNESKYKVQFGFLVEFIGVCVSICFVLFTCVVHGTVNQVCIAEPVTSNISTFKIIQLRRLVWVPLNQQSVRACSQSKITARNLLTLTFPYSKGGSQMLQTVFVLQTRKTSKELYNLTSKAAQAWGGSFRGERTNKPRKEFAHRMCAVMR